MAKLGLELSDVGVQAVLIEKDGATRTLHLGRESEKFPAYAFSDGGRLVFGNQAREASMVYPRRVCNTFIDDLSFQSAHLEGHGRRLTYSQIAYGYFEELLKRIEGEAGTALEGVALAVPGHYLETNEKSEERLGLLLGIIGDLKLPVSGIVDMAAASLYSEGLWNIPEGECIFHIDLHLHATHITVFRKEGGLKRVYFSRLPQHGFAKVLELFSGAMANRFLKHTAFDVTDDRRIERAFHAQTWDMLFHLGRVGEASLEVVTQEKSRQMSISRDIAALDLEPQVKVLTQMLLRAINDFAQSGETIQITLSERAATIQGLKDSIQSKGIGVVRELPSESGAFGAANYGKTWEAVANIEDATVHSGIDFDDLPGLGNEANRQVLGSINLIQEGKSLNPTHIVCDGLAYEIGQGPFVIGVGESEDFDLVVERRASGPAVELCRLVYNDDRYLLTEARGAVFESKSISGLKAGDALEVKVLGRRKRLLLIHCLS